MQGAVTHKSVAALFDCYSLEQAHIICVCFASANEPFCLILFSILEYTLLLNPHFSHPVPWLLEFIIASHSFPHLLHFHHTFLFDPGSIFFVLFYHIFYFFKSHNSYMSEFFCCFLSNFVLTLNIMESHMV